MIVSRKATEKEEAKNVLPAALGGFVKQCAIGVCVIKTHKKKLNIKQFYRMRNRQAGLCEKCC